jgi:hypothetical protein
MSVGKRRLSDKSDDNDRNVAKAPRFDSSAVLQQLKGQEDNLVKVKEALKAINYETVLGQVLPQQVKDVIVSMGSALNILLKSQETLTSVLVDAVKVSESNNAGSKQARTLDPKIPNKVLPTPIPPEVAAERKVKQALREAEKKTLLFNLNMGNVPTMNKDTLSRKVTLALSSKASQGEHDYDIKDAEETIDDILSCTKLEFLGTKTKQFFNKRNINDTRNNTFCTMPVRFEFKDKDTRIEAEKSLRKICSVSCAVPYPKRLRDIMDKMITEGKKIKPNSFIRTRIDIDNLTVEAHAKTSEGWFDLGYKTSIPLNILDSVNTVPQVALPPQASQSSQSSQVEVMSIS